VLDFGRTEGFFAKSTQPVAWSYAHTVRVDKDDNIWAVDKGSDMIVKSIGGPGDDGCSGAKRSFRRRRRSVEAGDAAASAVDGQFRQPTDVTWDPDGNISSPMVYQLRVASSIEWRLGEQWGGPGAVRY